MPNMLLKKINGAPLLRPLGVPLDPGTICLIVMRNDAPGIGEFLKTHPKTRLGMVVLPDWTPETGIRIKTGKGEEIPVKGPEVLANTPEFAKVLLCPANPGEAASLLTVLGRYLAESGIKIIYLAGKEAPAHTLRAAMPDFYAKFGERLDADAKLFTDEESRQTYTGRVAAILRGNSGYIPIAPFAEYFHPLVKPETGDVLIDGGVSDMVGAQFELAQAVGETGRIFGFEPIERLAKVARKNLAPLKNYHLQCAGLAEKDGQAIFDDLRDSSHISASSEGPGKVTCELVSIDSFCQHNHINHVDCIKLDVEGSELAALKGARQVILRDHPKLIVCLYHKPVDMVEIPEYLHELAPEYQLFLAHSSCQFMDTVLYARVSG